jgi:hypothetical protein
MSNTIPGDSENGTAVEIKISGTVRRNIGGSDCHRAPLGLDLGAMVPDGPPVFLCAECGEQCQVITVGTEETDF